MDASVHHNSKTTRGHSYPSTVLSVRRWQRCNACSGQSSSTTRSAWCTHDPRNTCPRSMTHLPQARSASLAMAARRAARGVRRPCSRRRLRTAATHRCAVDTCARSSSMKYPAVRSLTLVLLCGKRRRQPGSQHVRCAESRVAAEKNKPGPLYTTAQSGKKWKARVVCSVGPLPALNVSPPGYTVPFELRRKADRNLFTGVIDGDGSAREEQEPELCLIG